MGLESDPEAAAVFYGRVCILAWKYPRQFEAPTPLEIWTSSRRGGEQPGNERCH